MKKSFKRIIAIMLVVVSVLGVYAPAFADDTLKKGDAYVWQRSTNFRKTPSTSDSKNLIKVLERGTKITITGSLNNGFYPVKVDKTAGYIQASCLKRIQPTLTDADKRYGAYNYKYSSNPPTYPKLKFVQRDLNLWASKFPHLVSDSDLKGVFPLKADGKFGKNTKKAVVAYQKSNGLTADGVAGEKTLKKLYNFYKKNGGATTQ